MAKTILITGSTSGIGLATAKRFAARSYNIVFNGLKKMALKYLLQLQKKPG